MAATHKQMTVILPVSLIAKIDDEVYGRASHDIAALMLKAIRSEIVGKILAEHYDRGEDIPDKEPSS